MSEPPPSNPLAVRIREARPNEDHEVIHELFRQSVLDGTTRSGDTGADIDRLDEGYFSDDGASGFWVAEHDGHVVGMVGVQFTRKDAAEIRRLRVHRDFRRRGIGSRLLRHAVGFCRQRGYLKVVLDVRIERTPAIAMFEKFGFTLSRVREFEDLKTLDFYLNLYRGPEDVAGSDDPGVVDADPDA